MARHGMPSDAVADQRHLFSIEVMKEVEKCFDHGLERKTKYPRPRSLSRKQRIGSEAYPYTSQQSSLCPLPWIMPIWIDRSRLQGTLPVTWSSRMKAGTSTATPYRSWYTTYRGYGLGSSLYGKLTSPEMSSLRPQHSRPIPRWTSPKPLLMTSLF